MTKRPPSSGKKERLAALVAITALAITISIMAQLSTVRGPKRRTNRGARRASTRRPALMGNRQRPAPTVLLQSWGLAEKAPWQDPDQAATPNRVATKVA